MNTIVCNGFDGANPLHMLAALGVYRLLTLDDRSTTLSWTKIHPYTPILQTKLTENESRRCIYNHLGIRGVVALNMRRIHMRQKRDEILASIESLEGKTKAINARRKVLKANLKKIQRRIKRLEKILGKDKRKPVIEHLAHKHVFAGMAECIHKIPQAKLREFVVSDLPPLWVALLPGLTADVEYSYKKGEANILRSRLSFANGGSGKAILKDWLLNLAFLRRALPGESQILGIALQQEKVTGLMWNPHEMRDHALRWKDPNFEDTYSVPVLNVLAFIGLSFFTVLPSSSARGENTVGIAANGKNFVWPIWSTPLTVDVVTSLIASNVTDFQEEIQCYEGGITAVMKSTIFTANKRNFFRVSKPA